MLIYDALGNLKDAAWLKAKYGDVTINTPPDYAGPAWRVFALVENADYPGKAGSVSLPWWPEPDPDAPAAIIVKTLSPGGAPLEACPVARHWPGAPELPADRQHWKKRGVVGWTNVNGDVGFGMGQGDFYSPPNVPPTWVWIAQVSQASGDQPAVPTEAVSGLGMLAGTNHDHVDVVFHWDPGPEPPPPPPPPADDLLAAVRDIRAAVLRILEILPAMGNK
jgi:hypothetical protein